MFRYLPQRVGELWYGLSMNAGKIIHDGGFGPEELALLDMVFTATWKQIEHRFRDEERELARERLASIVVAIGHDPEAGNLEDL